MSDNDLDLLRQFTRDHSQTAFAEIVRRHVNLVYTAALRQVRSPQLAEDIAQSVFADLARDAGKLQPGTILTAWLYQVARRTAIDVIRKESRRQLREQIAVEMNDMNATANEWTQIEPLLDDALAALDETDRSAILLRFFENKSLRQVGESLGTGEDAAQKRVSRAVEQLREFFSKRSVTIGASGLAVLISANAVQSAPAGLAATISAAAVLAGTAVQTSTIIAATKTIAMTTLQKTFITAALATVAGTGIYEAHEAAQLRAQNQTLQQQQAPLAGQIAQLQRERDDATNRLADFAGELAKMKSNNLELLKLRGEVAQLRNEANNPAGKTSKTAGAKVNLLAAGAKVELLKQRLEQMPDRKIPELQFVGEKDWADAVWNANLDTDDDVREALSKLRETAENIFLNEMMKTAFKRYLAANNDILPADLFQLKPYFAAPVTDAMLQRYQLLQSGTPDNSADLVKLAVYADPDYDSNHGMSINGAWGGRFNTVSGAVQTAAKTFAENNNGQAPGDPSQLLPYLKNPIDAVTVQKYLNQIAANTTANGAP